jgi:predicted lipid-binding transport protein (Tim44 family)
MSDIFGEIGSMSAMLIMISIIAIGAVMAMRNKIANKRLRRSQMKGTINLDGKRPEEQGRKPERTESPAESDVNKELDDLKRDVDN